jgi:uncharacterized protein (TIRG00374 family)
MKKVKLLPFIFSTVIGIFLFVFILIKIGAGNIIDTLTLLKPIPALSAGIVFFIMVCLQSLRWKIILKNMGYLVSFGKIFMARTSGFSVSYLTPMSFFGGEPWRAYFLKQEEGIAIHQSLSSIFIEKIIDLLMGALLFLISFFYLITRPISAQLLIISILILAGIVAVVFWFFKSLKNRKRFISKFTKLIGLHKIKYIQERSDRLQRIEENLSNFFWHQRKNLIVVFLIMTLEIVLSLILFKIIILALGYDLNVMQLIFLRAMTMAATLVPIPAALGISEGGNILAFIIFGVSASVGMAFSLLTRCFFVIEVIIGLIFLSHFGIKLIKNLFIKMFNNGNGNVNNGNEDSKV